MDLSSLRGLLRGEGDPDLRGAPGTPRFGVSEIRASRAIVIVATLWIAAVCVWEAFGPILAGHYASDASMGIIAENMHRFRMIEPVWSYTAGRPDPALVYCHHPWGIFWTTAWFYELFGRHDVVCRLPAVLLSIATPPLLYRLGSDLYRPIAGATAAAAFVVLPITLSFVQFNALEVPVIAFGALFLWSWVRARATNDVRWFVAMGVAAALTVNSDWPGFVLVYGILAVEGCSIVARRPRLERRRVAAWFAVFASTIVIGGFYLLMFDRLGKLDDLRASYAMRSHGQAQPLSDKLDARRYWIDLCFTPLAIGMGKAGSVVIAARAALLKRAEELAPLAVLGMAVLQYVAFPQGADVHVFWPHHFALFAALATGAITATIAPPIGRLWGRAGAYRVTLAIVLAPLVVILREGVEILGWARRTGGRFSEKGSFIETDGDKIAVLRALAAELPPDATVGLHESMHPNWAQVWALGGRVVDPVELIPPRGNLAEDVLVADLRNLDEVEVSRILYSTDVHAYGPYLVVRRGHGLRASSLTPLEPNVGQWLFRSAHEPLWIAGDDPFLGWELAYHYNLGAAYPTTRPTTLEQACVAYDAAVDNGDVAAASAIFEGITRGSVSGAPRRFDGELEVVAARIDEGVQPRVTIVFRAGGPLGRGVLPKLRAHVVEGPTLSMVGADPSRRDVLPAPLIAPWLWRRGWLYTVTGALFERPGVEAFELSFAGPGAPRALDGGASVELFRY